MRLKIKEGGLGSGFLRDRTKACYLGSLLDCNRDVLGNKLPGLFDVANGVPDWLAEVYGRVVEDIGPIDGALIKLTAEGAGKSTQRYLANKQGQRLREKILSQLDPQGVDRKRLNLLRGKGAGRWVRAAPSKYDTLSYIAVALQSIEDL
eukprot:gb/GECG01004006.1/.p1 GENE.gb/GECG01004006.1/~~gb/GECG01004006.1/.p1  ORF type:complete len:149 (+),score=15.47 gb/GECG01004006.1/:1-447(+)